MKCKFVSRLWHHVGTCRKLVGTWRDLLPLALERLRGCPNGRIAAKRLHCNLDPQPHHQDRDCRSVIQHFGLHQRQIPQMARPVLVTGAPSRRRHHSSLGALREGQNLKDISCNSRGRRPCLNRVGTGSQGQTMCSGWGRLVPFLQLPEVSFPVMPASTWLHRWHWIRCHGAHQTASRQGLSRPHYCEVEGARQGGHPHGARQGTLR